jgi:hypothetical protein
MKNYSIFAAFKTKNILLMFVCVALFYVTDAALYAVNIRLSNPAVCCASNVGKCSWSRMGCDSLSYLLNFSYAMTKSNEDYSAANNSSHNVTPDCESVSNYLNLLPVSEQNSQELEKVDNSVAISSDANGSDISLEKIGNVDKSDVTGCNMNGNDNNVSAQHNTVSDNRGVTGITGTGHTINIYQCPQELINLITKLIG